MKLLLVTALTLGSITTSAFAKTNSRNFNCMPPGLTGVIMKGVYTTESKMTNGALEIVSSKVKINEFSFLINGIKGSSVPTFSAVTKVNGDGDDRVFSRYVKTTSKRILSIELTISEENDEQDNTVVKTSKGNNYSASCSFVGTSGH